MKLKSPLSLSLITLLGVSSAVLLSQTSSFSQDSVEFLCINVYEVDAGEKIPTTVVWIPEQQKNVAMIYWKSEYFTKWGWNPEKRCNTISPKMDQAHKSGYLGYLTTGKVENSDVICAVPYEGEICNSENQLFTVKQHQSPDDVLNSLNDFFEGKIGALYQSGGRTYIKLDLKKLANQPGVEID